MGIFPPTYPQTWGITNALHQSALISNLVGNDRLTIAVLILAAPGKLSPPRHTRIDPGTPHTTEFARVAPTGPEVMEGTMVWPFHNENCCQTPQSSKSARVGTYLRVSNLSPTSPPPATRKLLAGKSRRYGRRSGGNPRNAWGAARFTPAGRAVTGFALRRGLERAATSAPTIQPHRPRR